MKKLLLLLFAAALSLSASEPARAWGREGHETIAKIAERNLTKRAKKRIEKYLGGHSVVYYAKWMDEYRQTPEYAFTNDWHTAPVDADLRYGDELLKPGKGNAVYGLELAIRNLRDYRSLTDSAVAVNLKYVIHLVGDMHCPMHAGRLSDIGGNLRPVLMFGKKTNLHSAWDTAIPEAARKWSYTEWQEQIDRLTDEEAAQIAAGEPADWVKETHEICKEIYGFTPEGTDISYDYLFKYTPVVERQFLRGGHRLARLLNEIYR